jgi:formylglycine-generating enzyme required for sulfatase activity
MMTDDVLARLLTCSPEEQARLLAQLGSRAFDDELRAGLVALLADRDQPIPTHERVRAGFLLGELGDPRVPVTAEAWRREVERALSGDASGYFCRVPAGTYWIGCGDDDPDACEEERPRHQVRFAAPFSIARYPITNAQWAAWGEQPSNRADDVDLNRPNQPAVSLEWEWCATFCAWLSAQTGARIRLPTEQEWEAAARGGDTRRYPWGDDWRADCAATEEDRTTRGWPWSVPVGCYPAGAAPCGAMDMAGNVWEWTASVWQSYPGAAEGFSHEHHGVLRGGYYDIARTYARCGARDWWFLMGSVFDLSYGFRVVLAPPRAPIS